MALCNVWLLVMRPGHCGLLVCCYRGLERKGIDGIKRSKGNRGQKYHYLARRHRTGRQDPGTDARIMCLTHSKAELAVVIVREFFHWPTDCRNSATMQPLHYKARGAAWDGGSILENRVNGERMGPKAESDGSQGGKSQRRVGGRRHRANRSKGAEIER